MPTFVHRNGRMVDKTTGEPMIDRSKPFVLPNPMVMKPMPEYQSPVDGRVINSRQERKDDLARNNCIEWDDSMSPTKGKFKNKRFCKKRGLQVSEEFR